MRAPRKIHLGVPANLFDSGRRQEKAALASTKADFPSLPAYKNLLLSAQKQLVALPKNETRPFVTRDGVVMSCTNGRVLAF